MAGPKEDPDDDGTRYEGDRDAARKHYEAQADKATGSGNGDDQNGDDQNGDDQ